MRVMIIIIEIVAVVMTIDVHKQLGHPSFQSSQVSHLIPSQVPSPQAIYLTYLSTYPYLPTYLPIYLPTYLPIYLPIYLPTYLPTYLSTYISTYLPTYLPTYLSIYLRTFLAASSFCLSFSPLASSRCCLSIRNTSADSSFQMLYTSDPDPEGDDDEDDDCDEDDADSDDKDGDGASDDE